MKKFIAITATLILIIFLILFFVKQPGKKGTVLGASVNNFYIEKSVKLDKHPEKKIDAKDPLIYAESAVLIDDETKYPLYFKNETLSVPIASITKIMTAAVVLDQYELTDVIEVKKENTEVIGSKVFLKVGEKITVENLMYCLLMNSGNDAAKALATGKFTEEEFINLMNDKARELDLRQTKFRDPAGLDDSGRSSARDVAILFSYNLKNPDFLKIVSTAEKEVRSQDGTETYQLKNSNRLTTGEIPFDGIIGGKTGFTPDAGHTLVSAAKKDGRTIVGVVLKTNSNTNAASAQEMKKLLEWGFDSYSF